MMLRLPLLAGLILATPLGFAQTPPPAANASAGREEMIDQIKLADAPLDTVLQLLEQLTGRVIIRPATLPTANYTLVITRPMPKPSSPSKPLSQ
jgi:hypothetical protein